MGIDVELHLPPEIHVGGGVSDRAGELASALGLRRVLVVTDPVMVESGVAGRVGERLESAGIATAVFSDIQGEPTTDYVDAGEEAGATLVVDGRKVTPDADAEGFFVGPTLFDHVRTDMSIYTDEIFGPVLSVVRVDSYEEGVQLINDNPYGNGTAIFTNDGGAARKFQNEVQVGMIGINVPVPVPMAYYSFGGWKNSLFGDSHAHGVEGIHFFTRGKVITSRWLDPSHGGLNLGFPQNE